MEINGNQSLEFLHVHIGVVSLAAIFVSSRNAPPPLHDETKTAAGETNIGAFKLPKENA